MTSRDGKSQRCRKEWTPFKKWKSPKQEDRSARKGTKVTKHCVFPMICGSGGSKSRLAKAAGAKPAGQMRDRKSARRCGAKHISKSKCTKHTRFGTLLEAAMSKKCTPLWREAHFEVKMYKTRPRSDHFWTFRCSFCVAGTRDCAPCVKREQNVRVSLQHFQKRWQAWDICRGSAKMHFRVAGAVQETCSWELFGGQGADFLRPVAFWSMRSSGLLRWFCVTGAALRMTWHHFFVAGAVLQTDRVETSQNALHWYEAVSSAVNFPFLKEVSQNCFVFDVVKFEKWGGLAELFRFWRCHVQKIRKSRRIAAFLILSSSKNWGSVAK